MATQNIDDMHAALDGADHDHAVGGEASAKISAQAAAIAAGLAGNEGSTGSGPSFSIADTDDLTALMLMVCGVRHALLLSIKKHN